MRDLLALVAFCFATSVTPGPNNTLLLASGLEFGFRLTVPQIVGTALGVGLLALAMAAGIGALVTAAPGVELALRIAGSLYLLYLAYQVAGSHAAEGERMAEPMRARQALAFQFLNPKAWFFALAAVSTFRPDGLPVAVGSGVVALTMVLVVLPVASLWAAAGTGLHGLMGDPGRGRAVSAGLALLLAASVAFIWV